MAEHRLLAVGRSMAEVNSSKVDSDSSDRDIVARACSPVLSTWKGRSQAGIEFRPTAPSLSMAVLRSGKWDIIHFVGVQVIILGLLMVFRRRVLPDPLGPTINPIE